MRNRFDQLMKRMLREAFTRAGTTECDAEVSPDAQRIDLWFVPHASRVRQLRPFGLIARIARRACAFEAFHSTPTPRDLDACQRKHFNFRHILSLKQAKLPVPLQWVLSSGRPSAALTGFGCRRARGWPRGVYAGPPRLWLRVVVIRELPVERSTLLLRLMGAGRVLKRAIAELRALSEDAPERCLALPVLVRLRFEIPQDPAKQTSGDREFLMSTQNAMEMWERRVREEGIRLGEDRARQALEAREQKLREEGIRLGEDRARQALEAREHKLREEGLQQGIALARHAATSMYELRFGPMPKTLRARVEAAKDPAVLARLCDLAAHGTRKDIADAIRQVSRV